MYDLIFTSHSDMAPFPSSQNPVALANTGACVNACGKQQAKVHDSLLKTVVDKQSRYVNVPNDQYIITQCCCECILTTIRAMQRTNFLHLVIPTASQDTLQVLGHSVPNFLHLPRRLSL